MNEHTNCVNKRYLLRLPDGTERTVVVTEGASVAGLEVVVVMVVVCAGEGGGWVSGICVVFGWGFAVVVVVFGCWVVGFLVVDLVVVGRFVEGLVVVVDGLCVVWEVVDLVVDDELWLGKLPSAAISNWKCVKRM